MKKIVVLITLLMAAFSVQSQKVSRPNIPGPKGLSVNSYTGNAFYQRTDITLRGTGFPLYGSFYFNSVQDSVDYGYGLGWSFYYNAFYKEMGDTIVIQHGDAKKDTFKLVGGVYVSPAGVYDSLSKSGSIFTLRSKDGLEYTFANPVHKKLTGIRNRNNNSVSIDYAGAYPSKVRNSSGHCLLLTWLDNHLSEISDSAFTAKKYSYQYSNNTLINVTNPAAGKINYDYYNRLMVRLTDENNNPVVLVYSSGGRVKKIFSCNTDQRFTYIDTGSVHKTYSSVKTNAGVSVSTYNFDSKGRFTGITLPGNRTISYSYDNQDNITQVKRQNNTSNRFAYSANGNLLKQTDALGFTMEYSYHPVFNKVSSIKDRRGNITSLAYDAQGNLLSVTKPGNINETYTYNTSGQLTSIVNGNGITSTYEYNSNGDLVKIQSVAGSILFEYGGGCCNLSKITDANGNHVFMTYDLLNRLTSMKDDLDNTTTYEYDAGSNLVKQTFPDGKIKRFGYDAGDRLTSVQLPVGSWQYEYDGAGNFVKMTDAKGNVYNYAYDLNNRLVKETDPLGNTTTYSYTETGELAGKTAPKGNTQSFKYDEEDRLIERAYTGNSDKYSYDANGNLVNAFNNNIAYSFEYDALNRLTKKTIPAWNKTITYAYDSVNNRRKMTDPDGGINTYAYDADNRLTTLTNYANLATGFIYDAGGRLKRQNNANGTYATYTYDAAGRVDSILHRKASGDTIAYNFYAFDAFGNRVTMKDKYGLHHYTYDSAQRLTQVVYGDGSTEGFTLDANGNRNLRTRNNVATGYTYNSADQLQTAGTSNYTFDPNGNMTASTETGFNRLFTYDGLDRLTDVQVTPIKKWQVKYGPFGEKIEKTDTSSQVTRMIYDGDNLLEELNGSNVLMNKYTTALGIDSWLSMQQGGNNYFYQSDGLNSIVALTNIAGAVSNEYAYDVYGNLLQQSGNIYNPVQYTGRLRENSLRLYDYRSRMYNAEIGRFINRDYYAGNIHNPKSLNKYNYVENNPINQYDPLGLVGSTSSIGVSWNFFNLSGSVSFNYDAAGGYGIQVSHGFGVSLGLGVGVYSTTTNADNINNLTGPGSSYGVSANEGIVTVEAGEITGQNGNNGNYTGQTVGFGAGFSLEPIVPIPLPYYFDTQTDCFWGTCKPKDKKKKGSQEPQNDPNDPLKKINIRTVRGGDPNEIIGPDGYDTIKRWVSVKSVMPYKILFENDPKIATAPAQKVLVYLPIDQKLNPSSFRLGDFGFGNFVFSIPANTTTYNQRLDMRDSLGLYVDVTAGLDIINRRAFWIFESIDTATGLASTVPAFGGFLPVNDSTRHNGEGFVSLTLQPQSSAVTGDTTAEQASIIFDINDAIATNFARNTIDAVAPVSHINPVPVTLNTAFTLSWTGSDDPTGSGIKNYDLYVSKNNGPFTLEQANIDSTTHYFVGEPGSIYNFYTRATDNTGNKEAAKPGGEMLVSVLAPSSTICPGASVFFAMPKPGIGFSYQWQIDSTGTGFVNLSSNAVHTGVTTDTLVLNAPPTSNYGFIYRCVATNGATVVYGIPNVLKFQVSWQGNISTAWENPANWSCGSVPDQFTDVLVPGALINNPVLNTNTSCRSVKLSAGSSLNVANGVNLLLKGK